MQKIKSKNITSKHNANFLFVLFFVVLLAFFTMCYTFAKYSLSINSGGKQVGSADFYFSSDLLRTNTSPEYTQVVSDISQATIEFSLYNYQVDKVSGVDTTFIVKYRISGSIDGDIELKNKSGTLIKNTSQTKNISISLGADLGISNNRSALEEVKVYITVESVLPYEKSLYGTFVSMEASQPTFSVFDSSGSNSGSVIVSANGYSGMVIITLPTTGVFDSTDPLVNSEANQENTLSNVLIFSAVSDAEYIIKYYKTNPLLNFSENDSVLVEIE